MATRKRATWYVFDFRYIGGGTKGVVMNDLRIRKLTPRECWRLQAFPDDAFDKAQEVCSNTQLYKQAGNSITVTVLQAILKNLLD